MIRSWVKTKAAEALNRTGLDRVAGALSGLGSAPAVIGYHRVVDDFRSSAATSIPSMLVSRQMLERHLDSIGQRFRFVSLDELGARLSGCDSSRDPIAAVTFDDGYRDFYDHAFPVLMRKGIPAGLFVVTGLMGTTQAQIHDRLYLLLFRRWQQQPRKPSELKAMLLRFGVALPGSPGATPYQLTRALLEALPLERVETLVAAMECEEPLSEDTYRPFQPLTWEMIRRIHRSGITIGSHTKTHILMPNESPQRVTEEASESRSELERRLGAEVRHFAYPSGEFDSRSVDAVGKAGYRFAYTVCRHRDGRQPWLTVPRKLLWENSCLDFRGQFSESILSCHMNHAFDFRAACRHRARKESVNGPR